MACRQDRELHERQADLRAERAPHDEPAQGTTHGRESQTCLGSAARPGFKLCVSYSRVGSGAKGSGWPEVCESLTI